MSKVSRADWAAQVPATGIQGIIPAANLPTTPPSGVDMGSLTGKGFKTGQIAVWNGKKFVPADLPVPAGAVTFVSFNLFWTERDLRPLESTTQGVVVAGVTLNSQVFVQNSGLGSYVVLSAVVNAAGLITVRATNINPAPITLLDGPYSAWIVN